MRLDAIAVVQYPFVNKKVSAAAKAIRLFPPTNRWLIARLSIGAAASSTMPYSSPFGASSRPSPRSLGRGSQMHHRSPR